MANPIFHSQYTAQQIENEIANGVPRISSTTKNWERWNIETGLWEDTGIPADGQEAAAAAEAAAARAEAAAGNAEALQAQIWGAYPTDAASGAIATLQDGADGVPVKMLTVDITPVQAGSGDPSPSNPRPISGWTGAKVVRSPKNLCPYVQWATEESSIAIQGITFTFDYANGTVIANGTATGTVIMRVWDVNSTIPTGVLKPGIAYRISGCPAGGGSSSYYFYSSNYNVSGSRDTGAGAIITPTDALPLGNLNIRIASGTTVSNLVFKPMVSLASADGSWAYGFAKTQVISIPFGQTVYGGTIEDNGDGTWTLTARPYYASYAGETLVGPWISSMDVYAADATPTTGAQVVDLGGAAQTYTLTAESVRTLLGVNNIYADCGDIAALTYRADVGLYIAKKLAEVGA